MYAILETPHNDDKESAMPHTKLLRILAICLHLFIGIGAIAGGYAAVSNPLNPLGAPAEMLKNGPFDNFLIPGLFLMIVLGFGNVMAGVLALLKHKWWEYATGAMGDTLILWIVIQCVILGTIEALHVIFFLLGVLLGAIALYTMYKGRKFPFDQNSPALK